MGSFYELVAGLVTENDGEALSSAIDWAKLQLVHDELKSTPALYALVRELPAPDF
ncbi:Hypothetical protein SMAX5B_007859 [Scophthalmus maximus]|uniref:Uncharacterized protein n=1 Tax=Scophthalmus maximus TaxID=52904 RepID=A0A2U9C6Y8_SCOMX|nr:Hypothetical protein SMAX5B_007859 [Scophthalmus maximus]